MKKKQIKQKLKNTLVIASGIPRSGTSLLMQMLHAGGLEILSDFKRKADRSNPKGYMEFEAVKRLDKDNSCLIGQGGKAVKVISFLLKYLPQNQKYKVIFMNREMDEIIKSQQRMLGENDEAFPEDLISVFSKDLQNIKSWAADQRNIEMLNINYRDIIKDPITEIEKIINFLDIPLNKEKMADVVDPSLYRSKIKKKKRSKR